MKKLFIFLVFYLLSIGLSAQEIKVKIKSNFKYNNQFDLSLNIGKNQFAGALGWSKLHGFGKKEQRFKIGYGIRFTSFTAANQFYTTAPAKFTSTIQNLGTINSKTLNENIDSIAIQTPQVNFLNLAIHLQYTIARFDFGFNIDAAGISFGSKKKANIVSSIYDPGQAPVQYAVPTKFNLLLTSDNDIGSLNSEFYVRYWLKEKLGIRLGYTFLFSEYTTSQNLYFDNKRIQNDRYRLKSSLFMFGITYRPFIKS